MNARIQKLMLDQLKPKGAKGEPSIVLEDILEKAGSKYCEPQK